MGKTNGSLPIILDIDRPLPFTQRLIVLVPDLEFDEIALGKMIWNLALQHKSRVLFLSVAPDIDTEMRCLHRMVILSTVTRDRRFQVETKTFPSCRWETAIRRVWQPGDLLICFSDHQIRDRLIRRIPAAQFLSSKLREPVVVLQAPQRSRKIRSAGLHV